MPTRAHPDLELLREMMEEGALVPPVTEAGNKWTVHLTEPSCPDSHVTIHNLPRNSIVIRGDAWPSPARIFKSDTGARKRADFILVSAQSETLTIVYIEMKRRKGGGKTEAIQQLKGARCLMDYCQSIGKRFWNRDHFLETQEERYVLLRDTTEKRGTRNPRPGSVTSTNHSTPEAFKLIRRKTSIPYEALIYPA